MSTVFGDTATTVGEVAVGAAQSAAEVASNPIGSARKQVKGFERKGTPAVRRINRRINAWIPDRVSLFGITRLPAADLQVVRALADRSQHSTAQVQEILAQILRAIEQATAVVEEGHRRADAGRAVAGRAGESIRRLSDAIMRSSRAATEIANGTYWPLW